MSLHVILAPLCGLPADDLVLRTAVRLAKAHDAHVEALFVRLPAAEAVPIVGEGMSGGVVDQLMLAAEAEWSERRRAARMRFDAVAAAEALPQAGAGASFGWREVEGREDEQVRRAATLADLVVLRRETADQPEPQATITFETALLHGARPLLIAPRVAGGPLGDTVVIGWNGSAEAARAVSGALAVLGRAAAVHVVTAAAADDPEAPSAGDLVGYLGRHGIAAVPHQMSLPRGPFGAALLQQATALGADLLVLGGYGHGRMREILFGGVTRYVLGHATIAVLMAH